MSAYPHEYIVIISCHECLFFQVPFGEVNLVRDWLGINGPVGKPEKELKARPVNGFGCTRSEVNLILYSYLKYIYFFNTAPVGHDHLVSLLLFTYSLYYFK